MKRFFRFLLHQQTIRYIAFGFLAAIFIGSGLLMIPGVAREYNATTGQLVNLQYIDALFTSTSAVCVTGLVSVDAFDNFTLAGQIIIMLLIQIGGLGVTTLGTGVLLVMKRHVSLKDRSMIQESLNLDDTKTIYALFKRVFIYTFIIELIGAAVSFISFYRHYELSDAIFKSVFHSIAAFNNSGFDVFGGSVNMQIYQNDILLNVVTMVLIVLGGIGFLVLSDIFKCKFHFRKTSLHTKIVVMMTLVLIVIGTLALKLTERGNISWLGAAFTSVSARTAGFATFNIGNFSQAGLIVLIVLMFIGASPGSTGGGIKTTTLFVLIKGVHSMLTHKDPNAFKYSISRETIKKAMVVFVLAVAVVLSGTLIICLIEPHLGVDKVLFEVTSAYGTVGLSTGITAALSIGSKVVLIIMMYIGRIGPLTFMSLWYTGKELPFQYAEGIVPIG